MTIIRGFSLPVKNGRCYCIKNLISDDNLLIFAEGSQYETQTNPEYPHIISVVFSPRPNRLDRLKGWIFTIDPNNREFKREGEEAVELKLYSEYFSTLKDLRQRKLKKLSLCPTL